MAPAAQIGKREDVQPARDFLGEVVVGTADIELAVDNGG